MNWNSDAHPRDGAGKFSSAGGGSGIVNVHGQSVNVSIPTFTGSKMVNSRGHEILKAPKKVAFSSMKFVNAIGKAIKI